MKKLLILIGFFFCLKAQAQDTTKVANVSLSQRLVEYLTPAIADPANDENFSTFLKWRSAYRPNPPSGNNSVVTDTITVSTIAFMYDYILSNPEGFALSNSFESSLTSQRNTNANLDRQMTFIKAVYQNRFADLRKRGKRLLTGKDQ